MKEPKTKEGKATILIELNKEDIKNVVSLAKLRGVELIPFRTFLTLYLRESLYNTLNKDNRVLISNGILAEQLSLNLKTKRKEVKK